MVAELGLLRPVYRTVFTPAPRREELYPLPRWVAGRA